MRLILVVDGDRDMRGSLADCLTGAGYSVAEAAHASDGFRRLCSLKPHLVLLDQSVPSFVDGQEFLRSKAADRELASIPVVLMSGYLQAPQADGIAAFLRKPFDLDDILRIVEKLAGRPHEPAHAA
jgi:CheY-like chemotaxis protein